MGSFFTKENFPNAYLNIVDKSVQLDEKHVYGTVDQQLLFVKIYIQFWELREETVNNMKKQKNVD